MLLRTTLDLMKYPVHDLEEICSRCVQSLKRDCGDYCPVMEEIRWCDVPDN